MLVLDISKNDIRNPVIYARVNDKNSYPLEMKVLNGQRVFDLNGVDITFEGINSRGKLVTGGSVKIIDAKKGLFNYYFHEKAFVVSGYFKEAYFRFSAKDNIDSSQDLKIKVISDIGISEEEIGDIISLSDEITKHIEAIKKEAVDKANEAVAISKKALDDVKNIIIEQSKNPEKDIEVVQSRGDYETLPEHLDSIEENLTNKADYHDLATNVPHQNISNSNQKLVIKISDNEYNVLSRSQYAGKSYTLMKFKNGQGDSSEASYGKNFDLIRLTSVMSCSDVITYNQPKKFKTSKENKNKDDDFTMQTFTTGYDYPKDLKYISNNGKETESSYIEFDVDIKRGNAGELWLAFFGTKNSNKNVEVFVNNVKTDEIDVSNETPTTIFTKVSVGSKIGIVKVKLKVPDDPLKAKPIHFLGYNANELYNSAGRFDINGYLMNFSAGKHYITQSSGANEYAVREKATGKWFGSFHGGEKHIDYNIFLDEINLKSKENNSCFMGKCFRIIQNTDLISKVESQSVTEVNGDSAYSFDCRFDCKENFEVTDFYTCMSCFNDTFNNIISPQNKFVNENSKELVLPNSGRIIQFNGLNNQFVTTEYTIHNRYYTKKMCRVLFFKGVYAKAYHGLVNDGLMKIESLNFGNKKTFH